jgi:hypothetical protein
VPACPLAANSKNIFAFSGDSIWYSIGYSKNNEIIFVSPAEMIDIPAISAV